MQVWPKNDHMRKILTHPLGAVFRDEGPSDWPDDSFTHSRLMDGDISLEEPAAAEKVQPVEEKPQQDEDSHQASPAAAQLGAGRTGAKK